MSETPHDDSSAEVLRDLLRGAIPLNPTRQPDYITRDEFVMSVNAIESKIETAALKQKLWVLSGVIAVMLAFGGGYISLVQKLDRLNEAMPQMGATIQERGVWMQRKDRRDDIQDQALERIAPGYVPLPYQETPK